MIKESPELRQRLRNGENLRKIFARSRIRFFNSEGELLMEMTGHKMRHEGGGMSLDGYASGKVKNVGLLATFRLDDYGVNWIDGICGQRHPADMLFSHPYGYEGAVFTVDALTLKTFDPAAQPQEHLESGLLSTIAHEIFKWFRRATT